MVCHACGNPVAGPGAFCSRCGVQAPYPAAPMIPIRPRVAHHLQTLGILWFVYGAYRAATGLFAVLVLAGVSPHFGWGRWDPDEMWGFPHGPFWGAIMGFILVYTGIAAVLSFIVGFGLTTRKPWGRTLAIVTAVLSLIRPFFGTALAIYTLWVLAPASSGAEYEAMSYEG